jgi:hypothetical protein
MIEVVIAFIVFIGLPLLIIIWVGSKIIKTIQLEKELNNKMEILEQLKRGGKR